MKKQRTLTGGPILVGETRKRSGNPKGRIMPLRSFSDWDFKERDLHSFEMVLLALHEAALKELQEVEAQLKGTSTGN